MSLHSIFGYEHKAWYILVTHRCGKVLYPPIRSKWWHSCGNFKSVRISRTSWSDGCRVGHQSVTSGCVSSSLIVKICFDSVSADHRYSSPQQNTPVHTSKSLNFTDRPAANTPCDITNCTLAAHSLL